MLEDVCALRDALLQATNAERRARRSAPDGQRGYAERRTKRLLARVVRAEIEAHHAWLKAQALRS